MPPKRLRNRKSTGTTPSANLQIITSPLKVTYNQTSPKASSEFYSQRLAGKLGLSQAQKRALIQNLQLEITERARRLRAQYALQAQGLRTRVEIRVNRIPVAVRRLKMGDLLLKYSGTSSEDKIAELKTDLVTFGMNSQQALPKALPAPQRGTKRMSHAASFDQENSNNLDNTSSKRSRRYKVSAPNAPLSQVLSPRSANSRIVPKSPVRRVSPMKQLLTRHISSQRLVPKFTSGTSSSMQRNMATKAETRSDNKNIQPVLEPPIATSRGKRTLPSTSTKRLGRGRVSLVSQASDSSSSTVRRTAPARKVPAREKQTQVKRGVLGAIKGMGSQKKLLPTEKVTDTSRTISGRVLRKRK